MSFFLSGLVATYYDEEGYSIEHPERYSSLEDFELNFMSMIDTSYPSITYVVDKSGKKVLKSESYITSSLFKNDINICRLDDYMTDSIKKQLRKDEKNNSYGYRSFSYCVKDRKAIPVKLSYSDGNMGVSDTVQFTKNEEQYIISAASGYIDAHFYGLCANSEYALGEYERLEEKMNSYNFSELNTAVDSDDTDTLESFDSSVTYDKNGVYFSGLQINLNINRKEYYVYTLTSVTLRRHAFHNYDFLNRTKIGAAVSLICLTIALAAANNILKKIQMKQAEYAFSNAAAHELKTPLAIIQNRCELIMEGINPEKTNDYILSVYEESIRMNKLVKNLLQYNNLAMGTGIYKEQCDLDRIVKKEIKKYTSLAEAKGLSIESSIDDKCSVKLNDELISLVIDNFLSNAVKFAVDNSAIKVSLSKKGKRVRLSVFNVVKEIGKEEEKDVWEMLYKGDKSRASDDNSSGMGLAISRQILELHDFKYGYENKENGVEFYFTTK